MPSVERGDSRRPLRGVAESEPCAHRRAALGVLARTVPVPRPGPL